MRKFVLSVCILAIIVLTIPTLTACNDTPLYNFSDDNFGYCFNEDGTNTVTLSTLLNQELAHAIIPATVTHDGTTYDVTILGEAVFAPEPDGVTLNEVFNYDNSQDETNSFLQSVTFENGSKVTKLSGRVFEKCTKLSSVVLPESLTTIMGFAFYKNISLQTITIRKNIEKIDDYAFLGCTSLKTVNLLTSNSENLPTIGVDVFKWFDKSKVTFMDTGETYVLIEGMTLIVQNQGILDTINAARTSVIATTRNWADYSEITSVVEA